MEREAPAHFNSETEMVVSLLSHSPRVVEIKDLLSKEEADTMIALGSLNMKRSRTIPNSSLFDGSQVNESRTSSTAWLNTHVQKNHPVIRALEGRIETILSSEFVCTINAGGFELSKKKNAKRLTRTQPERENLQVLHYLLGQFYSNHLDITVGKWSDKGCKQQKARTRAATLLIYLNTVPLGGETHFPKAFHNKGLTIKPEVGKGILFWNQMPDGSVDKNSEHAALEVLEGQKWLATAWIQEVEASKLGRASPHHDVYDSAGSSFFSAKETPAETYQDENHTPAAGNDYQPQIVNYLRRCFGNFNEKDTEN